MPLPRTHEIDVIRLFALLGICIANISMMGTLSTDYGDLNPSSIVDQYTQFFISLFIESKFIFLFSMVLGWGIAIQEQRFKASNKNFSAYYFRRAFGLVFLGLLHTAFIFEGDILLTYGLACLVFWSMRSYVLQTPLRQLTKRFICSNYALWALVMGYGVLLVLMTETNGFFPEIDNAPLAYSFLEASLYRITGGLSLTLFAGILFSVECLAAFSLGYIAYHKGFFDPQSELFARLKKYYPALLVVGLILGVPHAIATSELLESTAWVFGLLLLFFSGPMIALSYLYFVIQLARRIQLPEVLVMAGRNSLSVYVLQGLIASLIFNGYGFGLIGELSALMLLGISIGIYCVSVLMVGSYAKVFGQGVLEPVLRAISGTKSSAVSTH